ncbi:hypothetical protein, partial [Acinetobacter baumannii]|uniref:hypothetical protein n=1 Tax=Acinetobacter baumannii TaxID=470 RepID=UPI001C09749E
ECRGLDRPNEPCAFDAVSDIDASIIAIHRTNSVGAGVLDAGRASAGGSMLELMTAPGINASQLLPALHDRLAGSSFSVTATRS